MYPDDTRQVWIKRLRRSAVILVALFLGWLAVSFLINVLTFHVSGTDPNLKKVPARAAYITVQFNKEIDPDGLRVSYSGTFVVLKSVSGNKIRFDLSTKGLEVGHKYTITLLEVHATDGKVITNKKLSFTARDIPVNDLDVSQQKALINKQDKYPYRAEYINYVNFDTLQTYITTDQMQTLKAQLYGYSNKVNKEYWTMTIVDGTLVDGYHDVQKNDFTDDITFSIKLGDETLNAAVAANVVDNTVVLTLTNTSGAVVYNSSQAD